MTERLYYTQPSLDQFDAHIVVLTEHEGKPGVLLDRTAFYPTSGGQPNDIGRLDEVPVVDVIDRDDGEVVHIVAGPLPVGQRVRGRIDWARRVDHMQQHTGQHILSAVFERLFRAKTVGFHLGAELSTIDLDRELPHEKIVAAEREANLVVWDDRPVIIRFASDEEAAAMPLRKDPGRVGQLRLIEIPGCDLSACGGTHVATSGRVGHIQVWTAEKFRGGLRIEFVCGDRALRAARQLRDVVSGCIKHLSVLPAELPPAVERVQAEIKDLKKSMKGLQERLAGFEAAALAARAVEAAGRREVVEALDGWDQNGLKALAAAIIRQPGYCVALFSTATPALAVVCRSADVTVDAAAVLRGLMERFGGRGGGKPDLAQGGGLTGAIGDMLEAARSSLRRG